MKHSVESDSRVKCILHSFFLFEIEIEIERKLGICQGPRWVRSCEPTPFLKVLVTHLKEAVSRDFQPLFFS